LELEVGTHLRLDAHQSANRHAVQLTGKLVEVREVYQERLDGPSVAMTALSCIFLKTPPR